MSKPKVAIEFLALLQTDDIPNGLSIDITPKTFILDNLDNLIRDGLIEIPLKVQIKSLEKVNGGEFFKGFSQINNKSTYQYQIPLTSNGGDGHKAIKASINFRNESKSSNESNDMENVFIQMSKFEKILELNRSELTDIKEMLTDIMFMSHPPSQETIETVDSAEVLSSLNIDENIRDNAAKIPNQPEHKLQEIISEMKKRDEAYGDDSRRYPLHSDPYDKIWAPPKPSSRRTF